MTTLNKSKSITISFTNSKRTQWGNYRKQKQSNIH